MLHILCTTARRPRGICAALPLSHLTSPSLVSHLPHRPLTTGRKDGQWISDGVNVATETAAQKRRMYDATAGKPSEVCDPYENKGKPLSAAQCSQMLPTVSKSWALADDGATLVREIEVDNFMRGAKLLTSVAAVSFNEGHFPTLTLERRIGRGRRWQEVLVVKCHTAVLEGLSYQDFMLAMLIDVELDKQQ